MKLVYLGFLVINLMINLFNWDQLVGNYSNVAWLLIKLWQPNGINVDNPFTWKHFQLKKKWVPPWDLFLNFHISSVPLMWWSTHTRSRLPFKYNLSTALVMILLHFWGNLWSLLLRTYLFPHQIHISCLEAATNTSTGLLEPCPESWKQANLIYCYCWHPGHNLEH